MNRKTIVLIVTFVVVMIGGVTAIRTSPQAQRLFAQLFGIPQAAVLSDLPTLTTSEQKKQAQQLEQQINAQIAKVREEIQSLRQASQQATDKKDTTTAATNNKKADALEQSIEHYFDRQEEWRATAATDVVKAGLPPLPPTETTPPPDPEQPQSAGPDAGGPTPSSSDEAADQQALLQMAALGVCIVQPELCLIAQALAGLLGSQEEDAVLAAIKMFAGAALGSEEVTHLLDAAAKNPKLGEKLKEFLDAAKNTGTEVGREVEQIIKDIADRAERVAPSPIIKAILQDIREGRPCGEIVKGRLSGRFASPAQKEGLYALVQLSGEQSLRQSWTSCLADVPTN